VGEHRQAVNVFTLVAAQAATQPDAVALMAPGRPPATYGQIVEHVRRVSSQVSARIAGSGRIAVVLPNGPEMATAFLAVASVAVCAPLNPRYREHEFERYLADLEPQALIVLRDAEGPAASVATRLGVSLISIEAFPNGPAGCFRLVDFGPEPAGEPILAPPDAVALVLHTSGTTARPKLVPLTHRNLSASARNISETLQLTGADRCLNVLPLFHIHGLVGALLATLSSGGAVVAPPELLTPRFFDWIDEFAPSWYTAVPTMHQAVLDRARSNAEIIARRPLRFIRSSSAALPSRVMANLEQTFRAPVIEAYGMTEAAHQIASNPLPPRTRKAGSVGRAAGLEIGIIDDQNQFLERGQVGEVVIRGDNVIDGYVANASANAAAFLADWFRTGDQGYLDPDGYLFLTGRLKELINRGGQKIAPVEIDEALMEHPGVARAVTFAVPDPRLGEEIAVAVVPHPGAELARSDVLAWAATRLTDFKLPRRIVFLSELPTGPTGKVERIGLAERLGLTAATTEGPIAAASSTTPPRTETERLVADVFVEVLRIQSPSVEDHFFRLGGDSLLATALSAAVEERLGVAIPMFVLFERPTVAGIAAYLDTVRDGPSSTTTTLPRIVRRGARPEVPLSPAQELLWVQNQLLRGTTLTHRPGALEITGALEHRRLRDALRGVVARHEVLRTTYHPVRGRAVGIVQPVPDVPFELDDLTGVAAADQHQHLIARQAALLMEPFDLTAGPLLRCRLVQLAERRHVMLLDVDHIAFDGWSMSVFARDLANLYQTAGRAASFEVPELPLQYADYAAWQRDAMTTPAMREQTTYWRDRLEKRTQELVLEGVALARDQRTGRGGDWRTAVPTDLQRRLVSVGEGYGGTMFMTLLSAFMALVARLSGETDLTIGTITSGRHLRDSHALVGLFMNELAIRADLSGSPSMTEVLERVRTAVVAAFAHQDLPFAEIARMLRSPRGFLRHPVFDIVFQMRNIPEVAATSDGTRFEELLLDWGLARFPLMVEVLPRGAELQIRFEFSRELFDHEHIVRLGRQYLRMLELTADAVRD